MDRESAFTIHGDDNFDTRFKDVDLRGINKNHLAV